MYTKNEVPIDSGQLPQSFADFFDAKIRDLVEEIDMDDAVYNGKKKLIQYLNTSWAEREYFSV
jgi:hypothetical protein